MAGVNKVILMGNLVADPELKTTASGVSVATFRIAVGRRFAKPEDEVKADFITIVAWRKLGEFIANHFTKGKPIIIVGSLQSRSWTDGEGQKKYATEVVADEAYFGSTKEQGDKPSVSEQQNTAATTTVPNFVDLPNDEDLPF